jgi:D-beta-D-heptose 7-phosphate kinase/D-beta-D-heptose 1-phosphate adenosyltransferase
MSKGVKSTKSKLAESEEPVLPFGTKGRYVDDKKRLGEVVDALKLMGAKVVLTMGTFDFIHIGHFLYLEKAKQHGDVLIVGVDSDKKVNKRKGPDRPIVSESERVKMLTHVRHVDIVTIKHSDDPKWALIKLVKPDVLIATQETYSDEQIKELHKYCKEVVVLDPQATTSTTAKIRRLNIGLSHKIRDAITESVNETFNALMKDA